MAPFFRALTGADANEAQRSRQSREPELANRASSAWIGRLSCDCAAVASDPTECMDTRDARRERRAGAERIGHRQIDGLPGTVCCQLGRTGGSAVTPLFRGGHDDLPGGGLFDAGSPYLSTRQFERVLLLVKRYRPAATCADAAGSDLRRGFRPERSCASCPIMPVRRERNSRNITRYPPMVKRLYGAAFTAGNEELGVRSPRMETQANLATPGFHHSHVAIANGPGIRVQPVADRRARSYRSTLTSGSRAKRRRCCDAVQN